MSAPAGPPPGGEPGAARQQDGDRARSRAGTGGRAGGEPEAVTAAESAAERRRTGAAKADGAVTNPLTATFLALIAIVVAFSVLAPPGTFDSTENFKLLAQNVAILTVVSVGTTFVIITAA
jgi:hypothetical protein